MLPGLEGRAEEEATVQCSMYKITSDIYYKPVKAGPQPQGTCLTRFHDSTDSFGAFQS
jgi:hypothetical protein